MEHAALTRVVEMARSGSIKVPLSFTNIYETQKINVPERRAAMALAQSLISGGIVFRGRRRILAETLKSYLAERCGMSHPAPPDGWFLSNLWFEAAGDYSPESYGFQMSDRVSGSICEDPGRALFDYLAMGDEAVRLETRRALVAGEPLALRRRAYGARLVIDELDFIFATARSLGLGWSTVGDIGSSLMRSMVVDVPVLDIERELVIRLEDQARDLNENDLRDMMSFITVIPFADVVVAEKQFVNLARQARLGETYRTELLTSVFDL